MSYRPQGEIAEALRRGGELADDDFDRLLARAITEMNGWADCALLLTMAERFPSEPVKRALLHNCHRAAETSVSCAALLCFLCGHAASRFDPVVADFVALFGRHVSDSQRRGGLERMTAITGYASADVESFARIERADDRLPPPLADLPAPPVPPARPASDPTPAVKAPPPPPGPGVASATLGATYHVESEMRGETIHYIEPERRTSMHFFWTQGYEIHADTILRWDFPADGRTAAVTPQERIDVVARVVDYARTVQGVQMKVVAGQWMHDQARGAG